VYKATPKTGHIATYADQEANKTNNAHHPFERVISIKQRGEEKTRQEGDEKRTVVHRDAKMPAKDIGTYA
jgi:hypothetical protein